MKFTYTNILSLLIISITLNTFAQSTDTSWKLYDDSQVAQINITMDKAAFDWMMANFMSDSLHVSTMKFKNKYIDTTLTNVGIRIRGNTSRSAQKKSFKLSFNDFVKGREFFDVDKLNLNGEHNDPSIARSKVSWNLFQKSGLIASRASYAAVYINDKYMGLYISVENIDDEFLKKRYYDDSGNLYKCLYGASFATNSSNYTQETNEDKPDMSQIFRLINMLNTIPAQTLPDSLEEIMYVDEFLKYEAMDVLIGQWDDYWSNTNNYYIYFEPKAGKFHWIPYDYDNTFGIDWFNYEWTQADPFNFKKLSNTKRPLIEKVLANNQYRDLYAHFLQHIIKSSYQYYQMSNMVLGLREQIRSYALADTYRRRDYQFTDEDFENSFNMSPFSTSSIGAHVKKSILQFVNERNIYLKDKITFVGSAPIVYKIDYEPKNPGPNDSIYVYASGFASAGVDQLNIQFHPGLLTVIYYYKMKFSPIANSTAVDAADRWVGVIPPLGKNGFGKFKIEITDKNSAKTIYPRASYVELKAREYSTTGNNPVINEFMADNSKTIKDPANTSKDEYDDWIELYNPTQNEILLTGMYLTDDNTKLDKWQFTQQNLKLKAGEHLLIWCDEQGSQSGLHTNFKLSKSGEYIALVGTDGKAIIDEYTFGAQQTDVSFGRVPSGGDKWSSMKPTPGISNVTTQVVEEEIPTKFNLSAYPNPFNPATTIQYSLPVQSDVAIAIYDLLGNRIWEESKTAQAPGLYKTIWNGENNFASKVSSGIYFCRIIAGKYNSSVKLMLLK
ncbi:MAG: CotH kinase family protein [Melioribacteraceae bacterium]